MKKKSSYQKLKQNSEATIKQLTDDIITLIENKDLGKVAFLKLKWKVRLDIEYLIYSDYAVNVNVSVK